MAGEKKIPVKDVLRNHCQELPLCNVKIWKLKPVKSVSNKVLIKSGTRWEKLPCKPFRDFARKMQEYALIS